MWPKSPQGIPSSIAQFIAPAVVEFHLMRFDSWIRNSRVMCVQIPRPMATRSPVGVHQIGECRLEAVSKSSPLGLRDETRPRGLGSRLLVPRGLSLSIVASTDTGSVGTLHRRTRCVDIHRGFHRHGVGGDSSSSNEMCRYPSRVAVVDLLETRPRRGQMHRTWSIPRLSARLLGCTRALKRINGATCVRCSRITSSNSRPHREKVTVTRAAR